jgi:carbonic anhydrase
MARSAACIFCTIVRTVAEEAWDYQDVGHWSEVKGWSCGDPSQSPIDIDAAHAVRSLAFADAHIEVDHKMGVWAIELEENAHTWEVVTPEQWNQTTRTPYQSGHSVTFQGVVYHLQQFHYHSPSENTINGRFFDMEAHHVHLSEDGRYLVLAVMMDATEDEENAYLSNFWGSFPHNSSVHIPGDIPSPYHAQPKGFLPHHKEYYYFDGSFTTPPCTLDVMWLVLRAPVKISVAQREQFRRGLSRRPDSQLVVRDEVPKGVNLDWDLELGTDNRPVQSLDGRQVFLGGYGSEVVV